MDAQNHTKMVHALDRETLSTPKDLLCTISGHGTCWANGVTKVGMIME